SRAGVARGDRAGDQPHLRPASLVPAGATITGRQPLARLLRLERHARAVPRGARHLQGLRALELDVGAGGEGLLLAPVLLAPAGPELREFRRAEVDLRRTRLLAEPRRRWPTARCRPLPLRARGHELREPPR